MTAISGSVRLEELLKALTERVEKPDALPLNLDIKARVLIDALPSFHAPCPFKVGDLVVPKPNNGRWKQSLGVCIVSRLLPPGTTLAADPDEISGAIHDVADMVLLGIPNSLTFMCEFKAASREFVAYTGSVA